MHLCRNISCAQGKRSSLEVEFYRDFHWVTRPWWPGTLANGSDVKDIFSPAASPLPSPLLSTTQSHPPPPPPPPTCGTSESSFVPWIMQGSTNIKIPAWPSGNRHVSFTCLELFWTSPKFNHQWDTPEKISIRLACRASDRWNLPVGRRENLLVPDNRTRLLSSPVMAYGQRRWCCPSYAIYV